MNARATWVAGDWGTSHLRLFLCRGDEILETRNGPGIAAIDAGADKDAFLEVLSELTAPWIRAQGALPVWLCGMIGSRNGWRETPYVPCPADALALARAATHFETAGQEIIIVPGVRCANPNGAPDVMRGEETQVMGALARVAELTAGRRLLALPGTHTKWVRVDDGRIATFQTCLSGELYALLCERSSLLRVGGSPSADTPEREGFELGLARSRELAGVPLTHLLFEVRSRQLLGAMQRPIALGYLSGLIIGQDVDGALTAFQGETDGVGEVIVIGTPELGELYRAALVARGLAARTIDSAAASVAGLHHLMG